MWDVEYTNEFEEWWLGLTQEQQEALDDRVMLLAEVGPGLKRPVVGLIKASRHANMKELRASKGGALRVLFAFDPRRHAILLLGGDKSGQWEEWYRWAIPAADDLYDTYLKELTQEELVENDDVES
ncbi:MAG: diaminopimelate decarboxylase [Acidimicrobiia bacterium]|nr:diaminopimelate decarboxylase [Acidimicrobiia bacterium]